MIKQNSYRLDIFGFPSVSFMQNPNLGLLDQRLAIEWIRDNIAAFGGDPNRIVLFGDGSGATSIDFYKFAWTKDPIASGFIGQSGSQAVRGGGPYPGFAPGFGIDPESGKEVLDSSGLTPLIGNPGTCGGIHMESGEFLKPESLYSSSLGPILPSEDETELEPPGCVESAAWFNVSTKLGCGGRELGEKTLPCMKEKPWQAIMDALRPTNGTLPIYGSGKFGPVVDNKTVFSDYATRRKTKNFIKRVSRMALIELTLAKI